MAANVSVVALASVFNEMADNAMMSLAFVAMTLPLMIAVERCVTPAAPRSPEHARFNIRHGCVLLLLNAVLRPLTMGVPWILTGALGAGWIRFGNGLGDWWLAFVSVLLFTDLLEYLFHRAEHTFPVLWKLHEFHHTAEHYDVTLAYRHFWIEPLLKVAFLYPFVGIVFEVPKGVPALIGIIYFFNHHIAHMNLRYSPRFALLIQNPQFHRLHHSRYLRDSNRNFSDLFPVWDVLFGTARRPQKDEFVDVGLDSVAAPTTLWQALLWPWCRTQRAVAQTPSLKEAPVVAERAGSVER